MLNIETLQQYALPVLLVSFFLWRFIRFRLARAKIPALLIRGGIVVDVRSPGEFSAGSAPGSLNIPLEQLETALGKLSKDQPIILCCASGTRSGMAKAILTREGFREVINAGPWTNTLHPASH